MHLLLNHCDKDKCPFCHFPYPNVAALARHIKNANVIGQLYCSSCGNCKIPKYRKDFYRDDHHTCIGRVPNFEVGLLKIMAEMARRALMPLLTASFDDWELDRVLPRDGDIDDDFGEEVYTFLNFKESTRFTLTLEKRRGRSGSGGKKPGVSSGRDQP